MPTPPRFLQGSISQDFQGILDDESSPEAKALELAGKKKPHKSEPPCTTEPTETPNCTKKEPCKPPKKAAFLPEVQGWSMPPAPPAL
jgi:hypothetical protein